MREVGIFEYEKHPFFLYYLSQMANTDRNAVTVIVPETMHKQIRPLYTDQEYEEFQWVVGDPEDDIDSYFARAEQLADTDLDLLWVNTAWGTGQTPAKYLDFNPTCPAIAGITNLNDWAFNPFPGPVYAAVNRLTSLLRHTPHSMSTPIFQQLRYLMQPGILANYDAINIEYPPMFEYAEAHADWNVDLYNLIPVVYEESKLPEVKSESSFRIAIPGRISQNIRDYHQTLDALEPLLAEYDKEVVVDLVGRPAGRYQEIMDRVHTLRSEGYAIEYRTKWISFEDFATAIRRSDLILDPLKVNRPIRHPLRTDQQTGRKNGAGGIFDAIRYARPLVLPAAFPIDEMLEPFTKTYSSADELRTLLQSLIEGPETLKEFQRLAVAGAERFDLEIQRSNFDELVASMLD